MSLFKHTTEPHEHGTPLPEKLRHLGHTVSDTVLHPHVPEKLKQVGHHVSDTVLHPHMPAKLKEMGHNMSESVLHPKTTRCRACFAELSPEDLALGCCSDSESCGCRASSARCW